MENHRGVEILRRERQRLIEEHLKALADLDNSIEHLLRLTGETPPKSSSVPIKPGQYAGMKGPVALRAYLSERAGEEIAIAKILSDLEVGGASLGSPDRHERNLKIGISNNSRMFEFDEEKQTVRLIPGTGPKTRKRKKP